MAATGYTVIQLYSSPTASAVPLAANLSAGELAINTNDGKLYYKDSSNAVQVLASKATGSVPGSTTQVVYNNAGALAGSSNMTFNGTTLTVGGLSSPTLTNAGTLALSATSTNIITASTNGSERLRFDASGNALLGGTAARGTTVGAAHLDIFNGTAPAGTLTNGISLYSSSGDFNFMDSSGNGYKVGFRNVPAVGTKTSSYTLATTDLGKYVQVGTSGAIVIPDATFAEGDIVSIFNNTSGNITITCSITTAYISGTDTDKATMTLATRGIATVFFISGTVCVVSGSVT
jgi:hypothetical protein